MAAFCWSVSGRSSMLASLSFCRRRSIASWNPLFGRSSDISPWCSGGPHPFVLAHTRPDGYARSTLPRWTPQTGQLWRPLALGSLYTLWLEETAMVVYAFDVDETLEVSKGPVKLFDLVKLREHGHIVGLCGNWAMVTLHCPDWHHICSFVGPCGIQKHDFLRQLRQYIPGHDYVMVGNILGISGASDDRGAAERAGWRFIQESEFARGVR